MAKILIVEDSPAQAALIAELIAEAGHQPHKCTDASVPVQQLVATFEPDIVLLDLILNTPAGSPRADGFQLCREIKRHSPAISVVIVSAQDDEDAAEWAELQGADGYLRKPFAYEELLQTITALVDRASHREREPQR
jgi:DNA-binding response OmpR family regulator